MGASRRRERVRRPPARSRARSARRLGRAPLDSSLSRWSPARVALPSRSSCNGNTVATRQVRVQLRCRAMLIELQSHSTHSDGQLAAAEVVERAAEAGVTTLALSDHDSVAGVPEAAAAAERAAIELVP